MSNKKTKIIVILGPTSSGKTSLAVKLAYKFNGEIISADSRQVYKGMDIGTGKDLAEYSIKQKGVNIPYYLIDVVSPKAQFSLARFQKMAFAAIDDILERRKLPIIVGGSGLYLQALIDNYNLSKVKPDKILRRELEKCTVFQLFNKLKKINAKFASKLHVSDQKNKRRLIRYIEITIKNSKLRIKDDKLMSKYEFLLIGLKITRDELNKKIQKRLIARLEKENMISEVERLYKEGVSWERLENFGLEYKYIGLYLQKKLGYEEMEEKLFRAIKNFAKRQMTWFRRWERQGAIIYWIKDLKEADSLIKKFIT